MLINHHNLSRKQLYGTDKFGGKVEGVPIDMLIWYQWPEGPLAKLCGVSMDEPPVSISASRAMSNLAAGDMAG